ncbi:hypothetical protein GPECTOR_468g389 [Gonium pectorale]|uniref:Uncharacterized protein n=1 Tax=Gonium pectorale TaxID=33097 RepID=A0A150FV33_GONPE|nr:hypothetical protein GPECTOR_468g389 [Gonium pectorale]|eukprot:KXZ41438.1 hypothetical protein GPECTOR_468g389 [Gonium pectorale]
MAVALRGPAIGFAYRTDGPPVVLCVASFTIATLVNPRLYERPYWGGPGISDAASVPGGVAYEGLLLGVYRGLALAPPGAVVVLETMFQRSLTTWSSATGSAWRGSMWATALEEQVEAVLSEFGPPGQPRVEFPSLLFEVHNSEGAPG